MKGNMSGKSLATLRGPEILNALPHGAYITDRERTIIFWNRAAETIMGWSSSEVVGRTCFDNILLHVDKDGHELCGKEYCPLHRCIITGEPSAEPVLVYAKHRSGQRIPVEVSVAPIRNSEGAVVGGIELFSDLSEREQDLARARQIQGSLLESVLPPDPRVTFGIRYTSSEIVGGDFYRIEQLDEDRYAIMVADVMGHGVASALYTMLLRSMWEDGRSLLTQPAEFVAMLNRKLQTLAEESGYFATAVYLVAHVATNEIQLVRAGHPAPICRDVNGALSLLGTSQPAIGMPMEVAYTENRIRVSPGSSLILYTDGAIEAQNAAGQELGLDGLTRILNEPESQVQGLPAIDHIEESILKFSGALHPADDLTLISMTWARGNTLK